uniref:Uncharacterized protein n=1 Tax=Oryza glumipatula TaxID=40148 RepID=A0A0G2KBN1_9ORYZ
MLKNMLSS